MVRGNKGGVVRGSPDTAESEASQGEYAKLVLPAATYDYLDAIVTYVDSWTTVHIQLANAYRTLSKLQKQLQQIYRNTKSLSNPTPGSAGIMKYGSENDYYRVLIIKRINPTLILVRFVDFGNTDVAAKELIHPISKNLTNFPAQAFPIQMELKQTIAGSISLSVFREYLTNAKVIVQLGDKIVNDSFAGIIYVIDKNNKWYSMNEAIELKIPIKKLMRNLDKIANENTVHHTNAASNNQVEMNPFEKTVEQEYAEDQEVIDQEESDDDQINDITSKKAESDHNIQSNDNGNRFIANNPENEANQFIKNWKDRRVNSKNPKKRYRNQENAFRNPIHIFGNNYYRKANPQILTAPKMKLNREESSEDQYFDKLQRATSYQTNVKASTSSGTSSNWIVILTSLAIIVVFIIFALFITRKHKWILSKLNEKKAFTTNDPKASHSLDQSTMTNEITESKMSWKNISKERDNLSSTNNKLKVEDLSSVIGVMAYGSLRDDIDQNLKQKYSNKTSRQHAGRSVREFNMSLSSSYTDYNTENKQEISEIETYTDDDNSQLDISANNISPNLSDIANQIKKVKLNSSRKNEKKNAKLMKMELSTGSNDDDDDDDNDANDDSDDETLSEISTSNGKRSTKTDTLSSKATLTTNIAKNKNVQCFDNESMSSRRLTYPWIPDDSISNDIYNSTRQNSTFQENQSKPVFSSQKPSKTNQSNSVSRISPICESNSVSRVSSVCHQSSSLSSLLPITQTIHTFSNENLDQSDYPYANSIHSSDFEIPTYLNNIPTSSYSQQFTSGTSKRWKHSQLINNNIKKSSLSNSTRTKSIETYSCNDTESGKCTSMNSMIPLTSQTTTITGRSNRCCIDFQSLKYELSQGQQAIDNFEQSIKLCPRMDKKFSHSELSEITSINSELSEISSCLNFEKRLKLSDIEEVQPDQSSSLAEDGLKMKIRLMPKGFQSPDDIIEIEKQQIDREINSIESFSSFDSITTTTTYESTQDPL